MENNRNFFITIALSVLILTLWQVVYMNPRLEGERELARIDDLRLKHFRLTVEKNSPNIELLNPSALPNGYYAEIGFVGNEATGSVPGPDTVWTVEGNPTLTPDTPVTLSYTNDKGLTFKRTIAVDDGYMFTVSDTVTNSGAAPVSLSNYGRVTRFDKPT